MPSKKEIVLYHIKCRRTDRRWTISVDGEVGVKEFDTKAEAVAKARRTARCAWKASGIPTQLMVHDRRGRFRIEASYGCNSKAKG